WPCSSRRRGGTSASRRRTCSPALSTSCAWRTSRRFGRPAGSRRAPAANARMRRLRRPGRARAHALFLPSLLGLPLLPLAAGAALAQEPGSAQESLSPLPPPVTRGLYRSHWFDYLSAFTENDPAAEKKALEAMVRAGRKVGVRRLSD